jgi:hypothetical protein
VASGYVHRDQYCCNTGTAANNNTAGQSCDGAQENMIESVNVTNVNVDAENAAQVMITT